MSSLQGMVLEIPVIGGAVLSPWASYVTGLSPVAWYRFREISGTNAANSGSGGAALNAAISGVTTLGQTGQLGANEAYLFDGATSRLQIANNAALASLTAWEYVFLINPSSAGETNKGCFACWGDGNPAEGYYLRWDTTVSMLASLYNSVNTAFNTAVNQPLALSTWQILFIAFNDTGDRKVHFYKGVSGSVAEYTYTSQPPLTGTYLTPGSALNLFNSSSQAFTFAGLGDEVMIFNGNLSSAQRLQLTTLAGV